MFRNKLNICFALLMITYACSSFKFYNSKRNKLLSATIEELKRKRILKDIDIKDTILINFENPNKKLNQYFLNQNGLQQIIKNNKKAIFLKKRPTLTCYYAKWTFDGEKYVSDNGSQKYTSNWSGIKLNFDYDNTEFGYLELENNTILKVVHIHSD